MRSLFALAVLLITVGCTDLPAAPAGAVVFEPPPSYAGQWQRMQACSGLGGDLARIHWFRVPRITLPDGGDYLGAWFAPHRIYLRDDVVLDSTSVIVPHEMLHDLLQDGHHPPVFERCGVR